MKAGDMKDAGCCTGHDVPSGTPESDLERGFSKADTKEQSPYIEDFVEQSRGFLTRPGGWER